MKTFHNRYRNSSIRLQKWDYAWDASYFVTICTHNRINYFGKIVNQKMVLSPLGVIADVLWYEIKNHAKNIELDAFVVMPDHIHGILAIDGNKRDKTHLNAGRDANRPGDRNNNGMDRAKACLGPAMDNIIANIQTNNDECDANDQTVNNPLTPGQKRFQNQGKNTLSSILGSYKSAVSKHAHRMGFEFKWQSRFYDHIIRNMESWNRIRNYIIDNPKNWPGDTFSD